MLPHNRIRTLDPLKNRKSRLSPLMKISSKEKARGTETSDATTTLIVKGVGMRKPSLKLKRIYALQKVATLGS